MFFLVHCPLRITVSKKYFHSKSADLRPYVILIGDIGAGKTTIVEKLTGISVGSRGSTEPYHWVPDSSLLISDAPSTGLLEERNLWITQALNLRKISR